MVKQIKQRFLHNNRGVTMSNLIVTVGIFFILAAIAVPNLVAQQPSRRLNGATRQVLAELVWARGKAAAENNKFVVFFTNNTTLTILDDDDGDETVDGGELTFAKSFSDSFWDVTYAVQAGSTQPVVFNSRGTAGGPATVIVSNSSGSKQVTVTITGNVRIID